MWKRLAKPVEFLRILHSSFLTFSPGAKNPFFLSWKVEDLYILHVRMLLLSVIRFSTVEEMNYFPVVIHGWLEITTVYGITKQVPVHIVKGVCYLQLSHRKRNLVWILAERGDVQETKKRAEWKIRKDSKKRKSFKNNGGKFSAWRQINGLYRTEVGEWHRVDKKLMVAVRFAVSQGELSLESEEKVSGKLFIYFSAMLSLSCIYLAQNCTRDESEDSTGVRIIEFCPAAAKITCWTCLQVLFLSLLSQNEHIGGYSVTEVG
jgi:hypothetical protein